MAGRKSTATMELAIGATIIAGVILLIVMLMAWGNSSSLLGRHYRIVVDMSNVGGLKEGAPVKMGGFQIGRVASIRMKQGATDMEIVLDIDEDRLVPRGSTAKVSTAGLVGDAFMEIIPSKSSERVRRASTVAEAERLDSSPLPDMSELFTQVSQFGEQLTILTNNLNDIIGDNQFRKNIKSLAVNMDAVAYQANLILQRGQNVIDNIETATQNVVVLSNTLKDKVEVVTDEVHQITGKVYDIADRANQTLDQLSDRALTIADRTEETLENLNGGITDIRRGVNATIGNEEVAADLASSIKNINVISEGLAQRREEIDTLIRNLNSISVDMGSVSGRVREITTNIEPASVATTLNTLSGAIASMTDVVNKIKSEPVLALSVNKAADRIVKMKFDEMAKQSQYKSADATLDEINRWVREAMRRGYLHDPAFSYTDRPYVLDK